MVRAILRGALNGEIHMNLSSPDTIPTLRPRRRRCRTTGFSFVEVMASITILVIGLLSVMASTTTQSLLQRRAREQEQVFAGIVARLEWARSSLFRDSDFQDAVEAGLAAGPQYTTSFPLDLDLDGAQDLPFAPNDSETDVLSVVVTAPDPPADGNVLLQVTVTARWYGVGGQRTWSDSVLVANRTGYGG